MSPSIVRNAWSKPFLRAAQSVVELRQSLEAKCGTCSLGEPVGYREYPVGVVAVGRDLDQLRLRVQYFDDVFDVVSQKTAPRR